MLTILFCNVQKCKEEKPQKHNNYSIFSFGIACHNFTRIILTVCVENFSLNKVYISNISKLKNIICLNVCSEQSLIPLASRTNIFFLKAGFITVENRKRICCHYVNYHRLHKSCHNRVQLIYLTKLISNMAKFLD